MHCNVHPLFRGALAPVAPAKSLTPVPVPTQSTFTVRVFVGGELTELNILAYTCCDAITRAIDILFDGDEPMPTAGLEISARPFANLPKAA